MSSYQIGNIVTLSNTFKNVAGVDTDPTDVRLKVERPDGSETEYLYPDSITKTGTGRYAYDLDLTLGGTYYYRWVGTGAVKAAVEGALTVEHSVFENPL